MRKSDRASRPPRLASGFIQGAMARLGVAPEWRALACWEEVCGPLVAAKSMPERVRHGILQIRVTTSAWASDLNFVKEELLERLRIKTGLPLVDLRFVVGPLDLPAVPLPNAPAESPQTATPASVDAPLSEVADPELRTLLRALGKRVLSDR